MSSKIGNLSELENVLCNFEKTNEGVIHFIATFKLSKLLSDFNITKTKGYSVAMLLVALILCRLRGVSINNNSGQNCRFFPKVDENTFYRLMNNPFMNWRRLLLSFAKQFKAHVQDKGDVFSGIKCFILDDTDLPKSGKTFEYISRIFNHVNKSYQLGYKKLLLGWWDGKSIVGLDFSLHRERGKTGNYGLTSKERRNLFRKNRIDNAKSLRRIKELDESKTKNSIAMLKRAVKNGFSANYVLMDSWFINDYLIKGIRGIKNGMLHVLGLCRLDKRKYFLGGKFQNARELIVKHEYKRKKYSKKYKSHYISLVVDYKGEKVKLFFIRYNNAKTWTLLLTTDLSLSFTNTIERYQIRWSIEVLFKECKQYLRLGASQNTDFDGQIADATLALVTHTILTLQKRFVSYETMGGIFREMQQKLLEMTLWDRLLRAFVQMVVYLLDTFCIDVEETMKKLFHRDYAHTKFVRILSAAVNSANKPEKTNSLGIVLV